jgi:hypothetical protein
MGLFGVVDEIYRVVDRTTKDLALQVGETLVVRLWSWTSERLAKDAETDHRIAQELGIVRPYGYSISAFALALEDNESVSALNDRLIAYVRTKRKAKYYCLIAESELTSEGFELIRSGPHDHHYDVPLGNDSLNLEAAARLAHLFGYEKIRMPA